MKVYATLGLSTSGKKSSKPPESPTEVDHNGGRARHQGRPEKNAPFASFCTTATEKEWEKEQPGRDGKMER